MFPAARLCPRASTPTYTRHLGPCLTTCSPAFHHAQATTPYAHGPGAHHKSHHGAGPTCPPPAPLQMDQHYPSALESLLAPPELPSHTYLQTSNQPASPTETLVRPIGASNGWRSSGPYSNRPGDPGACPSYLFTPVTPQRWADRAASMSKPLASDALRSRRACRPTAGLTHSRAGPALPGSARRACPPMLSGHVPPPLWAGCSALLGEGAGAPPHPGAGRYPARFTAGTPRTSRRLPHCAPPRPAEAPAGGLGEQGGGLLHTLGRQVPGAAGGVRRPNVVFASTLPGAPGSSNAGAAPNR